MLEIKKISKSYKTGDFVQHALKDVSLNFRKSEFVAILGPSGSGKTTLLNIIGGLDRYDTGDLVINSKSTKKFKDTSWDAYRNNCVGFIFQSYNLITHVSVLSNVELSLTLSGVSPKRRKKKALEVLEKVGLKNHAHKKPNQLSGGQMQRVAIARALVNDPDIILADEPTGALDTKTSVQIMELIKEISKDKLVIMVTHNPELANEYASRIVEVQDGSIIKDTNPIDKKVKKDEKFSIKKTAMSFMTALSLSFNNIRTKKGRTLLTAFAASIGIIGITLIMSLSNGFNIQIDNFEQDSLSQMPIIIAEQAAEMNQETMNQLSIEQAQTSMDKYSDTEEIEPLVDITEQIVHENVISKEYVEYINGLDEELLGGAAFSYFTAMNIITQNSEGKYSMIDMGDNPMTGWQVIPDNINGELSPTINGSYDILIGEINTDEPGIILQVDSNNRLSQSDLEMLGFDISGNLTFEEILAKEFKVISNDQLYSNQGAFYTANRDFDALYAAQESMTIKVQAIIRGKEGDSFTASSSGVMYTSALTDTIVSMNETSSLVEAQINADYNLLTGQPFTEEFTKEQFLGYIGYEPLPYLIYIYPKDFDTKEQIISYLDEYNEEKEENQKVIYTDMAAMITTLSSGIMDAITIVLIAFSSISLIVSSIMIGIITYISVLERTKEIGILRALGARKKDISRVFNAETFIIGLASGLLGIIIARLLLFPANIIIESLTDLPNVAVLNPMHALLLITISIVLTIISGSIPAKMASKKDPVEALRSE